MALDTHRLRMWRQKENSGFFFENRLHVYLDLGSARSREALPLRSTESQSWWIHSEPEEGHPACAQGARDLSGRVRIHPPGHRGVDGGGQPRAPETLDPGTLRGTETCAAPDPARSAAVCASRGDDRVPQRAGAGSRGEHPQRDRDLPEHRWVSLRRCESQGTSRCDLSGDAAELLDSWFPGRHQRAGRDPRPGEGAQELQEAPPEDDSRAEGCKRQLQIESRGRGCAGAAHPGAARHHLVVAQDVPS